MAVIQDDPEAVSESVGDVGLSWDLLLFSHRDYLGVDLLLPCEVIDGLGRVSTGRQQVKNWLVRVGLLPQFLDVVSDWSHVLLSEDVLDEVLGCKYSPILTQGADEAEVQEVADGLVLHLLVVVCLRLFLVLWLCGSKESSPLLVVSHELVWEVLEEGLMVVAKLVFGEGDHVEPCLLVHPVDSPVSVVHTCSGFEEDSNIGAGELASLDHDLEGHLELEGDLVSFEKTSLDVSVHPTGHPLDDVGHTILYQLSFGTLVDTKVEKLEELLQGGVVHPVDEGHLDDAEVKYGTAGCDWSVLLALVSNLGSLLSGFFELLSHLFGLLLDLTKHFNQLGVVKKTARSGSEHGKKLVLRVLKDLCIGGDVLLELG